MRILIVEDERKLAGFLRRALREDGHAVDACHSCEDGLHLALREEYDAIVLDLQLPDRDGISILRALRDAPKSTPVLILTARDSVKDRILGLDCGADDYLPKPFALDEFRARVRALLRRASGGGSDVLRHDDLTVSLTDRSVRRAGRAIALTPREYSLLEYLMRSPGKVLSRTAISEHVWDYDTEWRSNVVDSFIRNLRRKLEEGGEPRLIQTVRGVGYQLCRDTGASTR